MKYCFPERAYDYLYYPAELFINKRYGESLLTKHENKSNLTVLNRVQNRNELNTIFSLPKFPIIYKWTSLLL